MKIHRSALGLVLLVSLSMAKTIPTSEKISSPAATEQKKTLDTVAEPTSTKPETPEEIPAAAIAVEGAQEPKQADRTKKSATTTFCVEIRPGAAEQPAKVCNEHNPLPPPPPPPQPEPQIPNPPPHQQQEFNHHEEEHEQPFFVIPPNPVVFIPNNEGQSFVNYPSAQIIHQSNQIQTPSSAQHIIIPSPPSFSYPSIPAQPSQHIIIPSASGSLNCPSAAPSPPAHHLIIPASPNPGLPSQHIVIPGGSTSSAGLCPCQSVSTSYPQTLISLFRSAMARNDDNMSPAAPMDSATMEMRSGGSPAEWLDNSAGSMLLTEGAMEPSSRQMSWGSESGLETPFGRTHNRKIYAYPITPGYYGSGVGGYQTKTPYVVQCNPQVLALGGSSGGGSTLVLNSGRFRDADGNSDLNNMENGAGKMDQSLPMNEAQMNLASPQGAAGRHVIYPIVQPIIHTTPGLAPGFHHHSSPSLYQQSSTYQTIQTRPIHHSLDSGYMIHPGSQFYRREGSPQQMRMWNNEPAARNTESTPPSDMDMQQQFQGKSWNQQAANSGSNMERSSSDMSGGMQQQRPGQQPGAMSPSQMLNQMRGVSSSPASGSSSFGRTSPVMQSFPREHDESSPCKEGVHVNMHIPPGGQPYMIGTSRNSHDNSNGGAMHDEMGKRQAEKSAISEIDA